MNIYIFPLSVSLCQKIMNQLDRGSALTGASATPQKKTGDGKSALRFSDRNYSVVVGRQWCIYRSNASHQRKHNLSEGKVEKSGYQTQTCLTGYRFRSRSDVVPHG